MKTILKSKIEEAIQSVLDENSEADLWTGWIHPGLASQMTEAAAQVFDASETAQQYRIEQDKEL